MVGFHRPKWISYLNNIVFVAVARTRKINGIRINDIAGKIEIDMPNVVRR
jgi:hypothetical protein